MSLGRYGYDNPEDRKVRIHVMVDRRTSSALDKVRAKRSLSELVNGVLAAIVRAYDPGPAAPLVHELERVLSAHEEKAKSSGDSKTLAAVKVLWSRLEPYSDLANSETTPLKGLMESCISPRDRTGSEERRSPAEENLYYKERGYDWYAVPVICHDTPMTYMRSLHAWKCSLCGGLCGEGKTSDASTCSDGIQL